MLRNALPQVIRSRHFMQPQTTVSRYNSSRAALARLPIPDLHKTLQQYLKSLEPFLLEDDARGGPPFESAYEKRKQWAEDFERGIGKECQDRLHQLDRISPHNWLDDNIWLKKAYHEWRAPLLINSNWWLSFVYDYSVPKEILLGIEQRDYIANTGVTRWQVRRAACLVHRALEFKAQLERQEIYPDTTREGIWFRRTLLQIFNTSRIPRRSCDTLSPVPPATDPSARTILLCVHDWFYTVGVLDEDLQLISVKELESRILAVVQDVSNRLNKGIFAVPISVLSADDRDKWTGNLNHLLSLSQTNHDTLRSINHSIIALSLDHYTYVRPSHLQRSYPVSVPDTPEEVDDHLHNLRSSHPEHPARNRWWDKPLTFIVEANTRAGAIGEHSSCDALVPSILTEYSVVQGIDDADFGDPIDAQRPGLTSRDANQGSWRALEWVTDDQIKKECEEAERRAKLLVDDSDDSVLWFNTYGAEWIKKDARQPPDAYIQMALQLAWYRTRNCFTATYETTLTRLFHHGRTETIRTLSSDSRAFILDMADPSSTVESRRNYLLRALQTHTGLSRAAATGKGIDRHLLGLRLMLRPEHSEHHALFEDELFSRSQIWKLSTSALSAGDQFRGTGFGTLEPDGYGINYLTGPDVIKFGIESKYSSPLTSTQKFRSAITQAMLDMRALFLHSRSQL